MCVFPLAIYFPQDTGGTKSKIERNAVSCFAYKVLQGCCVAKIFRHGCDLEIFDLDLRIGEVRGDLIVMTQELRSI